MTDMPGHQHSRHQAIQLMEEKRREFRTMQIPTAKWKVFRECNYQCSYCTVWQNRSEDPSTEQAEINAVAVSEAIPPSWRFYLTGGELTAKMGVTEVIVRTLAQRGHSIRIISNFSAPIDDYIRLMEISDGKLTGIFLTRHPQYDVLQDYTEKALNLKKRLPSYCEILVRQVVTTTHEGIHDFLACWHRLKDAGIELYPLRLMHIGKGQKHLEKYDQPEIREAAARIFEPYPHCPDRYHTYCPAGFEYVYITPALDVYSCMPYTKRQEGFLGNCLKQPVHLREQPMYCELKRCHCVPGR